MRHATSIVPKPGLVRIEALRSTRARQWLANLEVEAIDFLHQLYARPQHVAVIETAARPEHAVDLREHLERAQVPRCPLQRHDVEVVVREGQFVDVADHGMDAQAMVFGEPPADSLHRRAAIDGANVQIGLPLEQVDANDVGARTCVEDFRARPDVHGRQEAAAQTFYEAEGRIDVAYPST